MRMSPTRGFTLIELVISAALMSMLLTGAYLCLQAGVASRDLVHSREEILQNARVAMALLSADLRAACSLSKDVDFVGMHRTTGEVQADNLDFATHNYTPTRAHEADWCEVSYFLDKDRETGKFSLWRRRDPTPDEDPFSGGKREELARGVAGLKLEYYDGFDWYEEWGDPQGHGKAQNSWRDRPNLTGLPEAVRVTLWMDSTLKKKETAAANETPEPPLVFQTVARLNLAAVVSRSSGSGAPASSPSDSSNAGAAPGGGTTP